MYSHNEGKEKEGIYEETDGKEKTTGRGYVGSHVDGASDRMWCVFHRK